MKVKELLEVIHPLYEPLFVVHDLTTNQESTYSWVNGSEYEQELLWDFGERTLCPQSVVFGEDNCEELFMHLIVE